MEKERQTTRVQPMYTTAHLKKIFPLNWGVIGLPSKRRLLIGNEVRNSPCLMTAHLEAFMILKAVLDWLGRSVTAALGTRS